MNEFLSKSKDFTQEYCATVVKIGHITQIEGANRVAMTEVNGRTIVISNERKEGDVMIYVSNESQLNKDFCSINNLYSSIILNNNRDEVEEWLAQNTDASEEEQHDYLIRHKGYFDDKARVKMKKLAGQVSMGILLEPETLVKWCPILAGMIWESFVGLDFDTVCDECFVKPYAPERRYNDRDNTGNKRNKRIKRFDRMIPGQFVFHYDTQLFERNFKRFNPFTEVYISNKLHGTSFIISNVMVKKPKYGGFYTKIFNYLPKFLQWTVPTYDVIYSSRSVIKNSTINPGHRSYSKGLDACFDAWYERIKDFIPENFTVYGEIVGYCEGTNSFIQTIGKGYDYQCKPGENKFMIYRVSEYNTETQTHEEYEVENVLAFTRHLKNELNEAGKEDIANRIMELPVLYHGLLKDLYPNLKQNQHWKENFLDVIKTDVLHFGMEKNEPECRNAVPREGIVFRIVGDKVPEAFKLKCLKFLGKEAKEIDKGNIDAEMDQRYSS